MNKTGKLINSIIFASLIHFASHAQNSIYVNGYIKESGTGESIILGNIRFGNSVVATNEHGFYSVKLNNPGPYTLLISHIGYETIEQTMQINRDTMINHFLIPSGIELQEVIITNQSEREMNSKGLGNIQINASTLKITPLFLGERDIIKTMQFLPGISSGMEGSSQLNIRGGTNDQTLYLMDGVPVYNQNHTFGFFSIFNPSALLSADIYKGGIPAKYGDRLSGVASIYLKNGNRKEHRQALTVGPLAGSLTLEGPIIKDKASYLFTARRSFYDLMFKGITSLINGGVSGATLFMYHDINAKISWDMNKKTKLSWQLYNGKDDMYVVNRTIDPLDNITNNEKFGFGWNTLTSSINAVSALKSNIFLSIVAYYSQLNNFSYYTDDMITGKNRYKRENNLISDLEEAGFRTSFDLKAGNINQLAIGFETSYQSFRPNYMEMKSEHGTVRYDTDRLKLHTTTLFLHDEITWGKWSFAVGLRASNFKNEDKSIFGFDPRLKLSTWIANKNKLMLAYDRIHQPIHSIHEMNYNTRTDFWVPFKENQIPFSDQISFGWKNYLNNEFSFSVEAYYKKMNNLLMIKNLENYLDFHADYVAGEGESKGVEVLMEYLKNKLSTWLSYTLSKSTRNFENKVQPFKYDAPHNISLFAGYVVHNSEKWKNTLSANFQYKTGYPYYVEESDYPSVGLIDMETGYPYFNTSKVGYIPPYPNMRIKDYFRADLNFIMEKKVKKGSRSWQFSCLNVTGHQNPYVIYRTSKGQYEAFLLIPFLPSFSYSIMF
jgi:outer membrane receptor for ferrienterochelin and colicin